MSKPIEHAVRKHAFHSPSAAHRWVACPGSPHLIEHLRAKGLLEEDQASAHAELGTALHEMCEHAIASGCPIKEAADWAADKHPAYASSIREMHEPYGLYVERIRGHRDDGYAVHVEHRMDTDPGARFAIGGTADAVAYNPELKILRVYDVKTGRQEVAAEDNVQLAIYAALALGEFVSHGRSETQVILSIFQPTSYPFWGEWTTTGKAIKEIWHRAEAAALTEFGEDQLIPGDAQCRWCPAKGQCPAFMERAAAAAREAVKTIGTQPGAKPKEIKGRLEAATMFQSPADAAGLFRLLKTAADAYELFRKDLGRVLAADPEGPLSGKFETKIARRQYVRWRPGVEIAEAAREEFGNEAVQPIPAKDLVRMAEEADGKDGKARAEAFISQHTETAVTDAITIKVREDG